MKKIGEGVYNNAFLTDEGTVILAGKCDDSFEWYMRIKNILDALDGCIKSVQIPNGANLVTPCKDFPNGAIRMSFVKGKELGGVIVACTTEQKRAIGRGLADFVIEIQSANINLDGSKQKMVDQNNKKLKSSLSVIAPFLSKEENEKFTAIAARYNDFLVRQTFVMTHGDLQEENIMLDTKNRLSGIVDFGNAEYYVSHVEFCAMMEFDSTIFDAMLEHYCAKTKTKLDISDIKLVALVRGVRFFRHVTHWGDAAKQKELQRIRALLLEL
ncbi:MAG: aminoglycoside phosphotransferase family protein [Firmicutes bacterium]|nr:aminoglycoside phosphotransferase family protein [Bacillota bacterium]